MNHLTLQIKFSSEYATQAQWGSRCIALLILNLGARWGRAVKATSLPLYLWERTPLSIVQEAPGPAGRFWRREILLSLPRFEHRRVQPTASRYNEFAIPATFPTTYTVHKRYIHRYIGRNSC
jgi:hypothetical protein